jgi:hypothetical protein
VTAAPGHRPAPARAGGDVPRRWRFPVLLLGTGLAVIMVGGCGSSGPPPPWRSGHPDPGSLSLLDSAQAGSCASKAPDPDQAPAAISFTDQEYVQTSRTSSSSSAVPGAVEIDHTGDWSFWVPSKTFIYMVTPLATYTYTLQNC